MAVLYFILNINNMIVGTNERKGYSLKWCVRVDKKWTATASSVSLTGDGGHGSSCQPDRGKTVTGSAVSLPQLTTCFITET